MKTKLIILVFLMLSTALTFSQTFEKQGAGVTVLVHGWNPDGDQPVWMTAMANAITQRSGGVGHIANVTVTGTQGNLTATCSDWTFDLANQNHSEIVVLINWTAVANHLNTGITAQEVAAAIAPTIYDSQNGQAALAELPIHLIGHSRGGGMVFDIARLLGLEGVEVEHLTALDPHPLTAADPQPIMGSAVIDTPVELYENVLFADVYYQNIEFPEGEYVPGAYNRLWTSLPGGYHNETGYTYTIGTTTYNFSDHLNIILAYHGTIDLTIPTTNGEATMDVTERDWFNLYEDAGENTGFKYSRQIMGNRKSNDTPNSGDAIIDGFHNDALLEGNGARENLAWTNAVWPNVLETTISLNSSPLAAGVHNIETGDALDIDFIYRSYANAGTVTFYADLDRNPYNTNKTQIGTLELTATGSTIASNSLNWTVADLTVGDTYYIYTEIYDGTNTRYFYAPYEFKLTPVATEPSAGTGTETIPYEIETLENLYWLSQNSIYWDKYYIQTADIDAAETETWFGGEGFPPIGTETTPFTGTYNGDNYTISNLYVNRPSNNLGLFGYVGDFTLGGSLINIIVENATISSPSEDNWWYSGVLVGYIKYGEIDNCHTSGTVQGDLYGSGGIAGGIDLSTMVSNSSSSCIVNGQESVGGFAGDITHSVVTNCKATGDVVGTDWVGGFVGYNADEIYNCFATGNVSGNSYLGGFVGQHRNASGTPVIKNCYAWGNLIRLSGSTDENIGAFAGNCNSAVEISYSYAIGSVVYESASNPTDKGFVGSDGGTNTYTANFFNSSASVQTVGTGATPQTTTGMKTQSTFTDAGWDFMGETSNGTDDYWGINQNENSGYPFLKWQGYKLYTEITANPTTESLQCPTALENITLTGGTANTDGSFTFANPADIPPAGTSEHEVIFTPTNEENYSTVTITIEITVEDNTQPEITSTHNAQTIDANENCEAVLPDYKVDLTATDNCSNLANMTVTQSPAAGTTISGATNSVILKVEDEAGNFAEVSFNVEVVDVTTPVITSTHEAQTIDANENCDAILPDYKVDLTATDNCSDFANMTVTQSPVAGTTISGATNSVILKVEDEAGNFAEVSFNVEVDDTTAPVSDVATLSDVTAECEVTSLTAPTATDNCSGAITGTHDATLPITATTVVTWTYEDGSGNTSQQTQNVVIDDTTAPVSDVATLSDVTAECEVTSLTAPTATDNCSGAITGTHDATLPITATTVVTWTYEDENGNTSQQTQNVVIDDTTAPVSDVATLSDVTAECEVTSLTAPTATDNCSGAITGTHDATLPITATTVVTWTYEDENGNTSQQTQNVVIDDTTAPVVDVTTLSDVTAECEVTSLTAPTATDNCSGIITGTHDAVLPITTQGSTTITWSYEDDNGNITTQEQLVVVEDVTIPTITCIENQTVDLNQGQTFYTVQGTEFDPAETSDNCEVASIENDFNNTASLNGAQLPVDTTTIIWTITDNAGNENACSFDITVNAYVGIDNFSESGISVYPNPTKGKFTISNQGLEAYGFKICDITGNIIQRFNNLTARQYQIDISDQPDGVYILKILSKKGIKTQKIIKNK